MDMSASLTSPRLVIAVMQKKTQQEPNGPDGNQINTNLVLSCLNKAGQSSIFFKQSFQENYNNAENIKNENSEKEREINTERSQQRKEEILQVKEIVEIVLDNVINTS